MKETLQLRDFLKYRFVSNVTYAQDGEHAAYVIATDVYKRQVHL